MAALWDIVRNENISLMVRRKAAGKADEILGLDLLAPLPETPLEEFAGVTGPIRLLSAGTLSESVKNEIVKKVGERQKARLEKNWAAADCLRRELAGLGSIVKDLPDGSAEVHF